jgi:hypothetical protein
VKYADEYLKVQNGLSSGMRMKKIIILFAVLLLISLMAVATARGAFDKHASAIGGTARLFSTSALKAATLLLPLQLPFR